MSLALARTASPAGLRNDTVNVSAAALGGDMLTGGGGINTLVLTSAGGVNLGGVSKFATIDLFTGNSTVTVTDALLSRGSVTISDGTSGNNTVSAASDTAASAGKTLIYNTGPGTDTFTGGFENDTVYVSATALAGDVLTGGSGSNTLVLTSAGTFSLGEFSNFTTIDFAAVNNTVSGSTGVVNADVEGRQRHEHPDADERRHGQPRRGQQLRDDRSLRRQQHGDRDRHDAVWRIGNDQRRGKRQQQRQCGGGYVRKHWQGPDLYHQHGDRQLHRRVRERGSRSSFRRRRWAATR